MMSRPGWHWPRLTAQLRSLADRLGLGLLIGLSVLLLLLAKADLRVAALASAGLDDLAAVKAEKTPSPIASV